ncbi:MATE family multidrug exporter [Alloiococcus otitis]|uniref:MATE efflux family protein n=1 Tax=Alloiococcus otitis ATCC 51267 TaxID=883081 RepID=K9EXI4_9LACT|nr:MATE family efflux transporter [Alloiococcus otitis]EKU93905.1 MATE efflux family protein [Alloiococcus otitis ATCC 51267]SUU81718.1 MATE family multidrug exporter [Alloiococcus otitis]
MTSFKALDREYRHLLYPLLIEQIFLMLIGNVNVFLMSQVADRAVAATGIADQVMSIGTMAMGIITLGSTILMLRLADPDQLGPIQSIFKQTVVLNIGLATLIIAIIWIFGHPILRLMQTPEGIIDLAHVYLNIVSISLITQGLFASLAALLRSFEKVKASMAISIINTLLIILGNGFVVYTNIFEGTRALIGIGIFTVLARIVGLVIGFITAFGQLPNVWRNIFNKSVESWDYVKEILSLGIPSGMENVVYNLVQTIIMGVIASMGSIAIASKVYTDTITAIAFTVAVAGGQALQVQIGKLLRQDKVDRAKNFGLHIVHRYGLASILISLTLALLGPVLIPIFTQDSFVHQTVQNLLWICIIYDLGRVANEILIAILQVPGDVQYPVYAGIVTKVLLTVPLALLAGYAKSGVFVIYIIFALDELVRAVLFYQRWRQKKWL